MNVKFEMVFTMILNYLNMVLSKMDVRQLIHHTALEELTYLTLHGISLQDCWKDCENRVLCGSINYMRLTRICQLNKGMVAMATVQRKGYVFYKKESSSLTHDVQCGNSKCTHRNQVCDEATESCTNKECLPHTEIEGRSISGNMAAVGDKVLLQCKTGFAPAQGYNAPVTSLCGNNGTWQNKLLCIQECTMRSSSTILNGYQELVHGEWIDRPCPIGTKFTASKCICL